MANCKQVSSNTIPCKTIPSRSKRYACSNTIRRIWVRTTCNRRSGPKLKRTILGLTELRGFDKLRKCAKCKIERIISPQQSSLRCKVTRKSSLRRTLTIRNLCEKVSPLKTLKGRCRSWSATRILHRIFCLIQTVWTQVQFITRRQRTMRGLFQELILGSTVASIFKDPTFHGQFALASIVE